jgi:NADH dehydrogenase [ubiquinone] 1 alpha subcomplex assembly factor 7
MERLDAFMARANAAYYANHNPFDDFITAPEISQIFGELLGAWAAVVWRSMGSPRPVILAEAGPGRGTLMADALRLIRKTVPDFAAALSVHLVETSPSLRAAQHARLGAATFHDRVEDLPPGPMILLANEFVDALPIRQFVRRAAWMERFVRNGAFVERHADIALPEAAEGAVLEICEPGREIAAGLAARFRRQAGAALFIDYGPARSDFGDSFQALRHGKPADPLDAPGEADLTAHVDFQALAEAASGADTHGPTPQGRFLARLGLFQRVSMLTRTQPANDGLATIAAARRLADPDAMGHLFKALAICSPGLPEPPGFAE